MIDFFHNRHLDLEFLPRARHFGPLQGPPGLALERHDIERLDRDELVGFYLEALFERGVLAAREDLQALVMAFSTRIRNLGATALLQVLSIALALGSSQAKAHQGNFSLADTGGEARRHAGGKRD